MSLSDTAGASGNQRADWKPNALLSQKSVLGNDNAGADTRSTGIPLAFSGVGPNTIVSQSGE